jgi:uncharacterized protein (DUF302 family)
MADGLISLTSTHTPREAMDRLAAIVTQRGLRIFARVDHAAGAEGMGLTLRPTEVLIFGNPKGGTPLMQQAETLGIDLPMRVLVWQGDDGQTRLAYNDPAWLGRRHGLTDDGNPALGAMADLLALVSAEAVG